jgi:hypothetical protein
MLADDAKKQAQTSSANTADKMPEDADSFVLKPSLHAKTNIEQQKKACNC